MFWMVVLGCAGGVTEDSGESVDGFVKLFAGQNLRRPVFCAARADGTADCFGDQDYALAVPQDQAFLQILPDCQCGLDLDGEVLCWKEDWGLFAELPPGPYSRLGCSNPIGYEDAYVVAVRKGSGQVVVLEAYEEAVYGLDEEDLSILDYSSNKIALLTEGCLVDTDGQIACWPEYEVDKYPLPIPDGVFEQVEVVGPSGYCAIDADGVGHCFGNLSDRYDRNLLLDPPLLLKMEGSFMLTLENELLHAAPDFAEIGKAPQGGEYFVDVTSYMNNCAIPMDKPDSVQCYFMEEYPMEVPPPTGD